MDGAARTVMDSAFGRVGALVVAICFALTAACSGAGSEGVPKQQVAAAPVAPPALLPGGDGGPTLPPADPITPPVELPVSPGEPGFTGPSGFIAVDDAFFQSRLLAAGTPGAAMAIVKGSRVLWAKGYGYADIPANRAATPDTLFLLQSVSKPVVAVALLQLLEKAPGGLAILDQDVMAAGLPFVVRNPYFPNAPITFRMLLTHTSSLVDGATFDDFTYVQGDYPMPLGNFLAGHVQNPENWSYAAPGEQYEYSNSAAALMGHLVERLSGMSLQQYCQSYVFAPLGMNESSWFIAGLDPSHVAMPYELDNGFFYPHGHYGFPDFPSGQLRTSANQLARFLTMISGDGSFGTARLLAPTTMAAMKSQQLAAPNDTQGLILYAVERGGRTVIGHNGAYFGASTDMWFDPITRSGYVLLTNGGAYYNGTNAQNYAMEEINTKLLELALSAN